MAVTAGAVVPLDARRRRRHDLLAELREVDHWRRLVAARLDLAVAAVTAMDEPSRLGPDAAAALPAGLRDILGLPACDQALSEASLLLRLRAAQRDLDEYARALRAAPEAAAQDSVALRLSALLDTARPARRVARGPRDGQTNHLRVVTDQIRPSDGGVSETTAHSTEPAP